MTTVTGLPELGNRILTEPHGVYDDLLAGPAVCRVSLPRVGLVARLVTRFDDVRRVLSHPDVSKDGSATATEPFTHHMLNHDPPTHTRLRSVANRPLLARNVARRRERIEQLASEALDGVSGDVDLVEAFAYPFAMAVLHDLLGVSRAEETSFRQVADVLFTEVDRDKRAGSAAVMTRYLTRLVHAGCTAGSGGMLDDLVWATEEGRLSRTELLSTVFLLLVAGHENTVNLICNGIWALMCHPDQLRTVRDEPSRAPAAVEEVLRWIGPAGVSTLRHTTGPVRVNDTEIPPNEFVLLGLASANRDPARFADPRRFDITRGEQGLGFGYGVHHCLGASLARMEAEVAFRALLARYPDIRPAVEPERLRWSSNPMMRGPTALPVRLGRPATGSH